MKKKKPVRAVIDTNLFVSGLFAAQGYSYQLQQLWVSGAFEFAVSEQILKEIENTLLKPHIRKRLFLDDSDLVSVISLIREKAIVVTADCRLSDQAMSLYFIKKPSQNSRFSVLGCTFQG